jgi:phosphatidylserine/phosphatidylglycerophosphate/cardiolipin synthase-like enzyme
VPPSSDRTRLLHRPTLGSILSFCAGVKRLALGIIGLLAFGADRSAAQTRDSLATRIPFAMGQPRRWLPYLSPFGAGDARASFGGGAALGVRHPILNPITGLLSASAELVGDARSREVNGGVRLIANSPMLGLSAGVDWRPDGNSAAALFSFETAIRRGGLLGHGSMLRLDWLPTRNQTFALGVRFPVAQPFAGRTRPHRMTADVDVGKPLPQRFEPMSDSIERALSTVAAAAKVLRAYNSFYFDADRDALDEGAQITRGRGYEGATAAYLDGIATAFRLAGTDAATAQRVAAHARAVVLDRVILPYDALFGRVKEQSGISDLLHNAREAFGRWLVDSSRVSSGARQRVAVVFDRWLDILAGVQRQIAAQWNDSRLVWLPPTLALAPDEYDEQAEVDSLIGRAVGHPFTDDNSLAYLRTADLPLEIARSIVAARKYHVLWTHDFTGRRPSGDLDDISYTIVTDAYLPALTKAVERYDSTGVLPQYIILLDAYYYHGRDGRLWMDVLEDPLHPRVALRDDETKQRAHLDHRLAELHAAVEKSKRLQRDAVLHGGDQWIREMVRVHVNIVLPSDFSFRSIRIAPRLPFVPDNVMRDHRKIVLYDFTETNPYDGDLLVTGIGIGEHYASVTWEDRGARIRGLAALEARVALRRTLLSNGFHEDQIPEPLRETIGHATDGSRNGPRRDVARVLHVENDAGFGEKSASVARAMLYTLAPPGSVIIVPDPLWVSQAWVGMLAGAAARGSTVAIIGPALANNPNPQKPIVSLERDVLHRLIVLRDDLARRRHAPGTGLRVGVYAARAPTTDIAGRAEEVREGLQRAPWIREVIPFNSEALGVLDRATTAASEADASRPPLAVDDKPRAPQLHQKTQLIARPGAIAALVGQPGWEEALARALRMQAEETVRLSDAIGSESPRADSSMVRRTDTLLEGYERSLSEAERKRISFFFALGSLNHDPRGLMLDGEATVIVSGFQASAGLVDLFYLMARTTWVEKDAEIDHLIPAFDGLLSRLAKLMRDIM